MDEEILVAEMIARLRACFTRRNESGQSMIEFAMVLPALLLIITGILTFGLALNNYVTLTEATSVGARQIAILRAQGGDPCSLAATAIGQAAPLLQNTGNSATGLAYTFQVYTSPTASTTPASNTASPSCPSAPLTAGQPVTVTVTYPCNLKFYKSTALPSCYLTAQTTEVVQ